MARTTLGKCPKCGRPVAKALFERITIGNPDAPIPLRGLTYICPNANCHPVLGVQIDPFPLNEDLVDAIVKRLRHKD
jgi:hypothetical protein